MNSSIVNKMRIELLETNKMLKIPKNPVTTQEGIMVTAVPKPNEEIHFCLSPWIHLERLQKGS
jgi:hypothetical protein